MTHVSTNDSSNYLLYTTGQPNNRSITLIISESNQVVAPVTLLFDYFGAAMCGASLTAVCIYYQKSTTMLAETSYDVSLGQWTNETLIPI